MTSDTFYILMKFLLGGGLLGFAWWQVQIMRRDRLERERQKWERESANG